MSKHITSVKCNIADTAWIRVSKNALNITKDVYIGGSDIPGDNNPGSKSEIDTRKDLFARHAAFIASLNSPYKIFGGGYERAHCK